jgi:hypothetical protein
MAMADDSSSMAYETSGRQRRRLGSDIGHRAWRTSASGSKGRALMAESGQSNWRTLRGQTCLVEIQKETKKQTAAKTGNAADASKTEMLRAMPAKRRGCESEGKC